MLKLLSTLTTHMCVLFIRDRNGILSGSLKHACWAGALMSIWKSSIAEMEMERNKFSLYSKYACGGSLEKS
jgi:hypothetical protein